MADQNPNLQRLYGCQMPSHTGEFHCVWIVLIFSCIIEVITRDNIGSKCPLHLSKKITVPWDSLHYFLCIFFSPGTSAFPISHLKLALLISHLCKSHASHSNFYSPYIFVNSDFLRNGFFMCSSNLIWEVCLFFFFNALYISQISFLISTHNEYIIQVTVKTGIKQY